MPELIFIGLGLYGVEGNTFGFWNRTIVLILNKTNVCQFYLKTQPSISQNSSKLKTNSMT